MEIAQEFIDIVPPVSQHLFATVGRDIRRYMRSDSRDGHPRLCEKLHIFFGSPGLQSVLVYRFSSWVERSVHFTLIRYPLKLICYTLQKLCIICWGIHIDARAQIGGGLYIGHFGGVLIGPIHMGSDCNIAQQVTIGRRAGNDTGVPIIGDRVWIGAGSIVFGGIHIGDGVTIGPLTVVARSLPAKVLVMGNPMRLLRKDYDNSAEIYGKRASRKRTPLANSEVPEILSHV
jgi:serine O-acetyltransferase